MPGYPPAEAIAVRGPLARPALVRLIEINANNAGLIFGVSERVLSPLHKGIGLDFPRSPLSARQAMDEMLRILTLLMMCFAFAIGPGMQPAAAIYEDVVADATPAKADTARIYDAASTDDHDGCPVSDSCCGLSCPPCLLPLTAERGNIMLTDRKSAAVFRCRDCLRSIILGRDPPIPRSLA